jgi:hypothetical protein
MLRLNSGQRDLAAEKVADAANVALGAMVFGQVLSGAPFSITLASVGVAIWTAGLFVGVWLRGEP